MLPPILKTNKAQWVIVALVLLIPSLVFYAIENPDSWVAYAFFIEPTYSKVKFGYLLMNEFRSYSSVENIENDLKYEYGNFEGTSQNLSDGGAIPPYRLYTMEIPGYVHLDHAGSLSMAFFNDRLSSIVFYPSDPDSYREALMKDQNIDLRLSRTIQVAPHITLKYDKDQLHKIYFRWQERRLIAEQKAWIMRHS